VTDPFLPEEAPEPKLPSPWGFRIFVVLAAIYLLWRLGQGIAWVVSRLTG
jgi:hypothetical protein